MCPKIPQSKLKDWIGWKDACDYVNDNFSLEDYYVLLVKANWKECIEIEDEKFRHLPEDRRILGILEV